MANEKAPHVRPTWDEYFISIMDIVGARGTCDRGRAGSIAVKDNRLLVTGYVGAPVGLPSCDEAGHELHTVIHADGTKSQHCIRTTHSEQNLIVQGARIGVSLVGSTVYTSMVPCYACAKMLINVGIKRLVANKDYHASKQTKEVFRAANIQLDILEDVIEEYPDQHGGDK
jgi:dCMP deaminase